MRSKTVEKAPDQESGVAPRGVEIEASPEEFFEGVGCALTLKLGGQLQKRVVVGSAAQVRDRLRRGEFAKFDQLEERCVASWEGWQGGSPVLIRSGEVAVIEQLDLKSRRCAMHSVELDREQLGELYDSLLPEKSPRWRFWR